MAKESKEGKPQDASPKRTKLSQTDVPGYPLSEALRVPRAIFNNYGGDPTKPFHVAAAMELKPGSTQFKMLAGAAIAYGLTKGGPNAEAIELTDLARQILRPLEEGAELTGKRSALMMPRVVSEFLNKYNGSPLPKEQIAKNVLSAMGVPDNKLSSTLSLIVDEASALGLTTQIKGANYISLDSPAVPISDSRSEPDHAPHDDGGNSGEEDTAHTPPVLPVPGRTVSGKIRKVFISHGKNKSFIESIRKLLQFGELEAVVSVEKQSVSKPVSDKIMTDMRACSAAIIHVDGERTLLDESGKKYQILNSNVLIEIGAAMALYGRRFILLVKNGADLPSNLQGLYEVRYDGDTLDGDTTIRLLEAINSMKSEERA